LSHFFARIDRAASSARRDTDARRPARRRSIARVDPRAVDRPTNDRPIDKKAREKAIANRRDIRALRDAARAIGRATRAANARRRR